MINFKLIIYFVSIICVNKAMTNVTQSFNQDFMETLIREDGQYNNVYAKSDPEVSTEFNSSIDLYKTLLDLYTKVKLVRGIFIYLGSFITVFGSILNSLCIIVFYKSKIFRNSSFPFYVYVISVVDTINIFLRFAVPQFIEKLIRNTLVNRYNVNPYEVNQEKYDRYTSYIASDYHCSVFIYVYNSFTLVSVWLMVAVSLERLLIIKFTLQTKYMIKLRAFLILFFIFFVIFSLNIFDLAPGLYIKPQWYANLTLLCERDDTLGTDSNSTRIYKRLGALTFNTDTFAFTRTILQSIVPFLVVLIFNSLIIYNFKRIKLAARGRGKSNSCVSVNSFSGNLTTMNQKSRNSFKNHMRRNLNSAQKQNTSQLQIPKRSAIEFTIGSSRSPSPLHNLSIPNTPVTPTSLVSALNLVPNEPSALTQKTNSFLMPPDQMNGSATPSMGTTNSSANLSVATTTNLTNTTTVNAQQSSISNGCGSSSEKLSFMITSVVPNNKKHVTTTTTTTATSSRVSFKRRANKIRLNRETDIMLIVLSFSILLSQLPCTIAWYLIYYRNILKDKGDLNQVYFHALTPMLLYIIRLLEMCYFSLNFLFYITLSPSLRKELKKSLPEKLQVLNNLFAKCFCTNLIKVNLNQTQQPVQMQKSENENDQSNQAQKINSQKRVYSNSSGDYTDYLVKIRSISPLRRPNFLISSPYDKTTETNSKSNSKTNIDSNTNTNTNTNIKPTKTKSKTNKKFLSNLLKSKNKKRTGEDLDIEIAQNNLINSSNKIKIVIDNLYDEEEELKIDDDLIIDQNDRSFVSMNTNQENLTVNNLSNNKRTFNMSSPSFLNSFDTKPNQTQSISISKEKSNNYAYL